MTHLKDPRDEKRGAQGRIKTVKQVLYWKSVVFDFIIYLSFKIRNPLRILGAIISRITGHDQVRFAEYPVLTDLIASLQRLLRGNYAMLVEWFSNLFATLIVDKVVVDGLGNCRRHQFPCLVELDKYKAMFDEIMKLFREPKMLYTLLMGGDDTDVRWLDVYDRYLKTVSIKKIKHDYTSIPRPITIMHRAAWYKHTSFALFGYLPILDLIAYITFLAADRSTITTMPADRDRIGWKDLFVAMDIVVPFLQLGSGTEGEPLDDQLVTSIVELLSRRSTRHGYSDLLNLLKNNRELVKEHASTIIPLLSSLKKCLTHLASDDLVLSTPLQQGVHDTSSLTMEAAYPEFLLRHFSLMRREDKEDIVLDYLLRFNMFIEQHYKKFVMLLSNDEESSKTLGSLHLKLGMNGKFLTELRRIRNAISHGTCVISIDDGDILHSKIDFHYETRAGNRLVIKRVTKAWGELVDHLEKIYDIVLGLDRRVKYFLVQKKMINDDGGIIDAPSKEFLAFFSKK